MKIIVLPRYLKPAVIIGLMVLNFTHYAQQNPLQLTGPYFNQTPPGTVPELFVPEELRSNASWFWHGALVFSPDGNEFYLDIIEGGILIKIKFIEMVENVWSDLQPPAFSSAASDASPCFVNNGEKVFFISDRPNGHNYAIWSADRTQSGWTAPSPVIIPAGPNLGGGWRISVANDETIYLQMVDNSSNNDFDIYKIEKVQGSYTAPQRLSDNVNSSAMEINMFVDPDEQYIIFSSIRAGGYGLGDLYISVNQGEGSWSPAVNMGASVNTAANEGAPFVSADGLYLFFNSDRDPQYGRNPYWVSAEVLDDFITDVNVSKSSDHNPTEFKLYQNYPNPFNPSTKINFSLKSRSFVTLNIYDLIGNKVAALVNEEKPSGNYNVSFDGKELPSGIYFYKLTAGNFQATKKMILLK